MFLLHGQAQRMSVILSFRRSLGTASKDPVDDAALASDESRLAKAMYTCLIQYCPEVNVIGQGLRDANGFEVWRRLVLLSEPAHRTKAWVWRRHISQWSTALHQWEAELRELERTYKTAFSEDEKVPILAHVAPKELQQSIFMHSDALDSYSKIREYICSTETFGKGLQVHSLGLPKPRKRMLTISMMTEALGR